MKSNSHDNQDRKKTAFAEWKALKLEVNDGQQSNQSTWQIYSPASAGKPKQPSRKKLIKKILERLSREFGFMPDAEFKSHLTRYERGYYNFNSKTESAAIPREIKEHLKQYRQLVQEGDRCYERAESYYHRANRQGNFQKKQDQLAKYSQLHRRAESIYDNATEVLGEAISICQTIPFWLDRPVITDTGKCSTNPCPSGMPRQIDSRSQHNLQYRRTSRKRSLQITVLEEILECLEKNISLEEFHKQLEREHYVDCGEPESGAMIGLDLKSTLKSIDDGNYDPLSTENVQYDEM